MARRAPDLKILLAKLARNSAVPLHRQLYRALREALVRGEPRPGERLPSTRGLALALGVSRNTVLNAYDELAAEGLVVARSGSGTRAAARERAPHDGGPEPSSVPAKWLEQSAHARRAIDWLAVLRESRYPVHRMTFTDPDGTPLFLYDSHPSGP